MTKREAERWASVVRVLSGDGYGISRDDIEALRRIEMTLHRWAERECNGEVETDDDGKSFAVFNVDVGGIGLRDGVKRYRVPNREAGALRRLAAIMARYPHLRAYHQGDPRGCALYVYRQDTFMRWQDGQRVRGAEQVVAVPGIDAAYSSVGVAVCR